MTASRSKEFLIWVSDNRSRKLYGYIYIVQHSINPDDYMLAPCERTKEKNQSAGPLAHAHGYSWLFAWWFFFPTQKMNKSDVYRKRARRPMSTSVIQSKVDSKSLIGQTLRVQDWLNEKTVKGLQVMYRNLVIELSYHYELVAWFHYQYEVIIYLFINMYI